MARIVLCAVVCAGVVLGHPVVPAAQTALTSGGQAAAAALLARARRLMEAGQPDRAVPLLQAALAAAEATGDQAAASLAEVALGRAASMTSDATAGEWFARAEARATRHDLPRTLGFVETLRGNAAYERGDVTAAEAHYRRAVPHFERAGAFDELANTWRGLAVLEPPATGAATLRRALDLSRRVRSPQLEGQVLLGLSDQLFVLGRWADAYERIREALPLLAVAAVPLDHARARISLARLHRMHGTPGDAHQEYARAEGLLEPVARGIGLSTAWSNLSAGWLYLGEHDRAHRAAARAADVARRSGNPRDLTFATLARVEALIVTGRPREVEAAVLDAPLVGPAARSLTVRRAFALSQLARHAEALAIAAEADRFERGWMEAQPGDLARLAEIHRRAGRPADALPLARQAVQVLEDLRGNAAVADMLRVGFDDGFQWVHGRLVRVLAELSQPRAALEATETARARAFADLLASRDLTAPDLHDPGPVDLAAEVARRLDCVVVAYWTDDDGVLMWVVAPDGVITTHAASVPAGRLAALVTRTWSAAEPHPRRGRSSAYRELYDLLVRPVAASWRGAPGARVAIVPHGSLFRLSFAALMDDRGRYVVEQVAPFYAPSLVTLASLDTRARTGAPAAGPLVAAVMQAGASRDGHPLPPLPGALAEGRAVARQLGMADATWLAGGAATESAVRARMGDASLLHFASHAVVNDEHPMDSFLALAPPRHEGPDGSGRRDGSAGRDGADTSDGRDDGALTAEEVYRLRSRARLAVLSGCRTASGRVTGDGVVGLSRAFFAAGVPSLVASVWDLPDIAGQAILPAFYAAWRAHDDAARGLRVAQLAFLRALRAGRVAPPTVAGPVVIAEHPAVWASLVLIGAP